MVLRWGGFDWVTYAVTSITCTELATSMTLVISNITDRYYFNTQGNHSRSITITRRIFKIGELEGEQYFYFFFIYFFKINHHAPVSQANWCNMTFTAVNLFPSHSWIEWPNSSPRRDLKSGPQLERQTTYQLSYPSPQ